MSSLFEKALEKLETPESRESLKPAERTVVRDEREARAPAPPVQAEQVVDPYPAPPPIVVDPVAAPPPVEPAAPATPVAAPASAAPSPSSTDEPSGQRAPVRNAAIDRPAQDTTAQTSNYAEIDLAGLSAAGHVAPASADTVLSEQHRMIKRPLLLKAFPPAGKRMGNENVILVTSSVPGEGKTFVSTNLAMSIAMEVDRTVLLVDGDPAKGNISRILGISAQRGLTDYLASEELQLPDVLVRTNVPNLTVLPAGQHVANVTELFSSDQMKRLTDELASRYSDRVIIIDSAPLLAASGTRVLAGLAGQVVFVVEAVRTTQSAVREALHMIESHPNIGLVLNKSRERPRSSYHYGYYGPKA